MAYFILTHGVGTDPSQFITKQFRDYKKAKTALHFFSIHTRKFWKQRQE